MCTNLNALKPGLIDILNTLMISYNMCEEKYLQFMKLD